MSYITRRFISTVRWAANLGNPYSTNLERKAQIEQKVIAHAKAKGVDARGATNAIICSTEHIGGQGYTGNHVTTEYKDAQGGHITTHHVPV